jgi:hypothetical protein
MGHIDGLLLRIGVRRRAGAAALPAMAGFA